MSGGPFSGILGGGILGGMIGNAGGADAQTGTGILGALANAANNNPYAQLGMGAALLDGEGWGGGLRGFAEGAQQDSVLRLQRQKQAETEQKKVQAKELATKYGLPPAMAADPDRVFSVIGQIEAHNRTREPSEWEKLTQGLSKEELDQAKRAKLGLTGSSDFGVIGEDPYGNKQYGWINKRAGIVTPYGTQPQGAGSVPGSSPGVPGGESSDASSIPPPPPGADPKTWRQQQTRNAANAGQQSDKMRADLANARRTAENLKAELKAFGDMVRDNGAELSPGAAKSAMQTTYTNIQMQLKNLYELGAITGPDMTILNKLLEDPTADGVGDYIGKAYNRQARTQAQITQMQRIIDNNLSSAERNFGRRSSAQGATGGGTRLRFDAQGNPL